MLTYEEWAGPEPKNRASARWHIWEYARWEWLNAQEEAFKRAAEVVEKELYDDGGEVAAIRALKPE
ncbi:MAG: hypothetical protein ABFD60_07950 [Bryobacteraceae bacterium]